MDVADTLFQHTGFYPTSLNQSNILASITDIQTDRPTMSYDGMIMVL